MPFLRGPRIDVEPCTCRIPSLNGEGSRVHLTKEDVERVDQLTQSVRQDPDTELRLGLKHLGFGELVGQELQVVGLREIEVHTLGVVGAIHTQPHEQPRAIDTNEGCVRHGIYINDSGLFVHLTPLHAHNVTGISGSAKRCPSGCHC